MSSKKAGDRDLRDHIKDTVSPHLHTSGASSYLENIALHINPDAGMGPCPGAKGTARKSQEQVEFHLPSL